MKTPLADKLNKIVAAYKAQLPVDVGGVPFFIQSVEHTDEAWGGAIRLTVVTKFTRKEVGETVTSLGEIITQYGFSSVQEFHKMVSEADVSTPEKWAAFKDWQENDGSKEGLAKLPRRKE